MVMGVGVSGLQQFEAGSVRLGRLRGRIGHIYPLRRRIGHIYPLVRLERSGCKGEIEDKVSESE